MSFRIAWSVLYSSALFHFSIAYSNSFPIGSFFLALICSSLLLLNPLCVRLLSVGFDACTVRTLMHKHMIDFISIESIFFCFFRQSMLFLIH